jgi:hypothetical protein
MIFLDDDDTRRFALPFNPEGVGEYEYSNLVVVVVVILLVVKLVVIVPQKACVIKTFCGGVCFCVCLEDKSVLFFPPFFFAKSRTDFWKKKKILFVDWKKNMN